MKAPATVATGISVGKTFSSTHGVGISLNLRPSHSQPKASFFSPSRGELPGSGFINTKFSFRESLKSLSRPTINTNNAIRPIIDISRPTQVNLTSADKQEARLKTARDHSNTILAVIQFGNPVRLSESSRSTDGRTGVSRRSLLTAAARPASFGVVEEINRANRVNTPDIAVTRQAPLLRREVIRPDISKGLFSGIFSKTVDLAPKVLAPVTRRTLVSEQTKSSLILATNRLAKVNVDGEITPKVVSLPEVKITKSTVSMELSLSSATEEEKKKKALAALAEQTQRESIVAGLMKAFAPDINMAKGLVQILKQTPELAPQAQELAVRALTKVQPRLLTLGKAQVEALVVEQQTQAQGRGARNGRVDLAVSGAWGPVYGYVLAERTWAKRYLATQQGLEGLAVKNAKTGKEFVDLLVLKYWLRQEQGLNSPIVEEGKDHAWNDTLEIIGKAGIQERFAAERFVKLLNGWTKPVDYRESGIPVEKEHISRLFNEVEYRKFMGWLEGVFGVVEDVASVITKDIPIDPVARVASQVVDSFTA